VGRSVYWRIYDRSPPWISPRSSRPRRSLPRRRRRTRPVQARDPTAAGRVPRSRRRRARHQRTGASPPPRGTPPRSTRGRDGGRRGTGVSCAPFRSGGHAGGRGPRWGVTRPPAACARMGIASRSCLRPTFGVPGDAPMGVVRDVHRWVPISLFRLLPRSGTRAAAFTPGLPRRPSPTARPRHATDWPRRTTPRPPPAPAGARGRAGRPCGTSRRTSRSAHRTPRAPSPWRPGRRGPAVDRG
jgi:hypothetical protein